MKKVLMILILSVGWVRLEAQFLDQDFEKINLKNQKKAMRMQTKCQSENLFERLVNLYRNRKIKYYPVISYIFSEEIKNYDSAKIILDYLVQDREESLSDFIGIKTINEMELVTGCNKVFFENDEYWTYAGAKKIKLSSDDVSYFGYGWGWKELRQRDFIFLFSVEGFINCIWFVENKTVFVFDLKELKVYDVDVYIREHLSEI